MLPFRHLFELGRQLDCRHNLGRRMQQLPLGHRHSSKNGIKVLALRPGALGTGILLDRSQVRVELRPDQTRGVHHRAVDVVGPVDAVRVDAGEAVVVLGPDQVQQLGVVVSTR